VRDLHSIFVDAIEFLLHNRETTMRMMLKFAAVASFASAVATSAEAMTPAPIHQPEGMITQVALGCGLGRTRVAGVCVARTTIRHARRAVRRCARWHGGVCARYY